MLLLAESTQSKLLSSLKQLSPSQIDFLGNGSDFLLRVRLLIGSFGFNLFVTHQFIINLENKS